jgi:hypothetical protein
MGNLTEELEFDRVTNCNELYHYKNQNYTTNPPTSTIFKKDFVTFHQNIRGLSSNKLDELFVFLSVNPPHIVCLKDHHLHHNEIDTTSLTNYSLGTKFCRNTLKNGGVCIFTHESIQSTYINLNKFCKEKDFEICAVKLHLLSCEICIITIQLSFQQNAHVFYY